MKSTEQERIPFLEGYKQPPALKTGEELKNRTMAAEAVIKSLQSCD
jgi:hypothetical protein